MAESGGIRGTQVKSADRHGSGEIIQMSDNTGASGNLPKYDGTGTLTDSSIPASNVALISKVQQEAYAYAADTGTANAYAVALSPAPTIVAGSEVVFKAANANTGASTLSVNGTSYPLTKNGAAALTGGEISAGQVITAKFDGTNFQISVPSAPVTSVNGQTGAVSLAAANLTDGATITSAVAGIVIDGGGSTPATGSKGFLQVPYGCTITGWTMLADQSGSAQITVKKSTYSGFPATGSIVASAPPNLSSAQKNTSTTLTGWTTAITAGDVLGFNLDSVSAVTRVILELQLTKN